MTEPELGSLWLRLLAVIALVAANAFFVAAEFALVAARSEERRVGKECRL